VLLGLTLTGRLLCPVAENDCPATFIPEIVTGEEPPLLTETVVLAV
jgi:hypothetical protein